MIGVKNDLPSEPTTNSWRCPEPAPPPGFMLNSSNSLRTEAALRTPPLFPSGGLPGALSRRLGFFSGLTRTGGLRFAHPGRAIRKTRLQSPTPPGTHPPCEAFAAATAAHRGNSAFRIISRGTDGFALRMQLIDRAEHSLDLQYFISIRIRPGQLITEALLRAADRGVHLRLLVDDGAIVNAATAAFGLLAAHPKSRFASSIPLLIVARPRSFGAWSSCSTIGGSIFGCTTSCCSQTTPAR